MGERFAGFEPGAGESFSAAECLVGVVRRLLDDGRDARIALAGNGEVILLPRAGRCLVLVRDMVAFCQASAAAFEIALIEPGSITPGAAGRDIDELLWQIGFHASRGLLLEGLSEYDVVQFSRWPNLSRLPTTPNAMRICALLVNHSTSIMMARRRLRVDSGEIRRIYTAASLAGIARVLNRKSAESSVEPMSPGDVPEIGGANGQAGPSTIFGILFNRISGM